MSENGNFRHEILELSRIAGEQNKMLGEFKDQIAAAHVLLIGVMRAFADTPGFKEKIESVIAEIEAGPMPDGAKKEISRISRLALYKHD
ncbi:TPA: hypothetical protein ACKQAW_000379 [Stenotrophomonas maltophilia]